MKVVGLLRCALNGLSDPRSRSCLTRISNVGETRSTGSTAASPGAEVVKLIDVLWLKRDPFGVPTGGVAGAFEVEHTTSIDSGIVRVLDVALGAPDAAVTHLFLVAPDEREADVRAPRARPAFSRVSNLRVRYLPYGELARPRATMARFGTGMTAVEAVANLGLICPINVTDCNRALDPCAASTDA